MKLSTALALGAAPLAMAKAVHNAYPAKRDPMLAPRSGSSSDLSVQLAALGMSGLGVTSDSATQVIIIWVNPGAGSARTTVNPPPPAAATGAPPGAAVPAAAPAPAAATHEVMVGGTAGLTFSPAEVKAAVGDMVVFTFMSANHTVTQSAFDTPCVAMPGGMDSGFQANPNNTVVPPPQVAMQVMVDTPLWFYCKQKGHCGKGMTFSINPSVAKTQAMFQSLAIAQNGTGTGTALTGAAPAAAVPASSNGTVAAAPATAPAVGSEVPPTMGQGTIAGGVCVCAVTCTAGSLPAANVQGLGAFGGIAGSLPMAMSEPVINNL